VKIVADSSPLITLAKISQLEILPSLYGSILITPEVYGEVAVAGAGPAGAAETTTAKWIEVHPLKDAARLAGAQQELGLAMGEVSVILLAIELDADALIWMIALAAERHGKGTLIPSVASEAWVRRSG